MADTFKQCLWQNFGAAIEMLKNAIVACPDELWYSEKKFFYLSYHTVIFLDYYLTLPARDFRPALPYSIVPENELPEGSVDDVIPDKYYSKEEMLTWLLAIRAKCKALITQATEDRLAGSWIEEDEIKMHGLCPSTVVNYTVLEILFYNFRHVQHHVGQLNFILRQKTGTASGWVSLVDE
jgi:hypothetical protein